MADDAGDDGGRPEISAGSLSGFAKEHVAAAATIVAALIGLVGVVAVAIIDQIWDDSDPAEVSSADSLIAPFGQTTPLALGPGFHEVELTLSDADRFVEVEVEVETKSDISRLGLRSTDTTATQTLSARQSIQFERDPSARYWLQIDAPAAVEVLVALSDLAPSDLAVGGPGGEVDVGAGELVWGVIHVASGREVTLELGPGGGTASARVEGPGIAPLEVSGVGDNQMAFATEEAVEVTLIAQGDDRHPTVVTIGVKGTVPDVLSMTLDEAIGALADFDVSSELQPSEKPEGEVMSQSVERGSLLTVGESVRLIASAGLTEVQPASGAVGLDGSCGAIAVRLDGGVPRTLTLESWFRLEEGPRAGEFHYLISTGLSSGSRELFLRIWNRRLEAGSYVGGVGNRVAAAPDTLQPGVWYHAAGVYDGASWRLYLDGELRAETASAAGTQSALSHWGFGGSPSESGRILTGEISRPRVWNRALSASEVTRYSMFRPARDTEGVLLAWEGSADANELIAVEPGSLVEADQLAECG